MENYIHPDAIKSVRAEVDITFSAFDDVPLLTAKAIHENSDSAKTWDELTEKKKQEKTRKVKSWLNTKAVEAMTPEMLNAIDAGSEESLDFVVEVEKTDIQKRCQLNANCRLANAADARQKYSHCHSSCALLFELGNARGVWAQAGVEYVTPQCEQYTECPPRPASRGSRTLMGSLCEHKRLTGKCLPGLQPPQQEA